MADVLPTETAMIPKLGYCNGVGSDGVTCFVRDHCIHHTRPALDKRTIFAPFRWWLSDHNKWGMECSEYHANKVAPPTPPDSDRCEHGIPRRFCTALHEGFDANGSPVPYVPAGTPAAGVSSGGETTGVLDPYRPAHTADVAPSTDSTAGTRG